MDSDTLVLGEPAALLIDGPAAARPIGDRNLSTTGAGDPADPFWRRACALLEVDYDALPMVMATISGRRVKALYNGGLLVARRSAGLYRKTAEIIARLVANDVFPAGAEHRRIQTGCGLVEGAAARFFGIDQVAFSLASACLDAPVGILPDTYNIPVRSLAAFPHAPVHIHYHALGELALDSRHPFAASGTGLSAEQRAWLQTRFPF